jgi:peptide/nickel transport system permease protein
MIRFLLRKLGAAAVAVFAISILTFFIFQAIPDGDPALRMAGRLASPEDIARIRHQWGFDRSLPIQYAQMMKNIFSGNVVSYTQQVNVLSQLERGLPATLSLATGACLLWVVIGVALAVVTVLYSGKWVDRLLMIFALAGVSLPAYLLGAVLLYYLSYRAGFFPTGSYVPLTEHPLGWAKHLILPWTTLSILAIGTHSRVLRAELLEQLSSDYILAARAKGLTEWKILLHHALRNAIPPVISLWGMDFAATIGGGAILIESIFDLHGIGQYAARSVQTLDVPPVLVIVMFAAILVVLVGTATDLIIGWLDPQVGQRS